MSSVFGTGRVAYPGLRAFSREEFDLFFGRESCVDEMVDTLGRTCFLAVLGTSGSGKSSLVRTGLLNSLELGFLASAGSTWRIAELRPRGHPIRSLAIALLGIQGIDKPEEAEIEILSAFLRRGPRSLIEWANGGHLPPRANLIVLADQFEELFRYEDYSGREEAEAFVKLLVTAAREDVPIYVAITMRSEYLGACTLIDGLPEVINRGLYLTPRMTREECRQAIVGPAEVCGFRIEDGLVNKLLNDLTDFAPWEAGGGHDQQRRLGRRADQLPLMQHVLNLLWQKARARNETDIVLTLADYEAAGGLGGALDRHADDIAASVPTDYADAIDPVFRSLVTGKTVADAVRRPTRFGELIELAGGNRDGVTAVVEVFRAPGVNFFTPGEPEPLLDDTIIDISHESLIRQWRRLSRCLSEEAHSADAWHQLLSRSERYEQGAGGLLTGLDLDNLVDWWERTKPTAAWANRYGNNFEDAQKFLRDSQFAEADLKRREEEEARKLIAAEEEANTGRRFKRLAVALAAALILAFAATGAAIYLWREANAEATAALDAQAEADHQRELAEKARAEAEEQRAEAEKQRAIAEAEAAAAEAARQEADEQRTIAEAKAAEAEAARQDAEDARAEAEAARAEADQIIDTSIAYFAKSLGEEVASIQGDSGALASLGYAGSLLSRLAEDTRGRLAAASDVDTSFIDGLRTAFVVQDALAVGEVPSLEPAPAGDATRWVDLAGGAGLNGLADWSSRVLRLSDRTGRVVAGHELPESFWGAKGDTPIAATVTPDGSPVVLLADTVGQLWVGSGDTGVLTPVVGGDLAVVGIDDLMADPDGGRVFVAYRLGKIGENGQSMFGSGLRVAVIEPGQGGSEVVNFYRMPRGAFGGDSMPFRLVGVGGGTLTSVADGQIVRTDLDAERSTALDIPRVVVDAGLTADGRYLLAGGLRSESGACFEAVQRDGFDDPWRRGGSLAPQPAGLVVEPPAQVAVPTVTPAVPAAADCLLLYDVADDLPLWQGEAAGTRFDTLRVEGDGAVAVIEGSAPGLGVLRIARDGNSWADDRSGAFDSTAWGLAGFGDIFAATAAAGGTLPGTLSADSAGALMKNGVLHLLAAAEPAGRVVAWRVGADEVQIVRAHGTDGADTALDALVYRPGQDGFVTDARIDVGKVACLPNETEGPCRIDAAALSPDGNWLFVTSSGRHAFVSSAGMLSGWQPNAGSEEGDTVAATITFAAVAPLDAEGRSFVASTVEDGRLRRITRPSAAPQPQGTAEDRFIRQAQRPFDVKAGDGGSGSEGSGGSVGGTSGGAAVTTVSEVRLPGNVVSDLAGFVSDPGRGVLYVWGPRIGLRAVPAGDGDMLTADVEFSAPIADVAPLAGGDVAVATSDGQLTVVPVDRFVRNAEGGADPEVLKAVSTGLGSFGAIDLWADGDRVVANAGPITVDGDPLPIGAVPAAGASADVSKVRAIGFRREGSDRLVPTFVVPWEHLAGQLADGKAVSVDSGGEVFAPPRALPQDDRLLALAIMREEQSADETPEFEIGFDMLHMRFAGEDGAAAARADNCGWVLGVAVRMAGELQDNVGEDVRRACDEPAATAPVVNAIFDDRIDERIAALVRLAPQSPLALAVLASSLRAVAPDVAEALGRAENGGTPEYWEATLATLAENGPSTAFGIESAAAGFDPFAHWMVAIDAERDGAGAAGLAEALFHYAYAERLFHAAGVRPPPQVVKRRLALARILSDDIVIDAFERLEEAPLDPAAAGVVEPDLHDVPLDDVSAWLDSVAKGDEATAKRLESLAALVEELKGDDLAETDPAAAADHFRTALTMVIGSDEALADHPGILGKIEAAEEIGVKLVALGDASARADTAFAVLQAIDATLTQPVRRDADPPELRAAIAGAFADLAAAGAAGYDLSPARQLALRFLDFDWESRYQSINQVGAERFYHELASAEAFAGAALAEADEADRLYWLGLRGRMRFWLSTLENEGLPYDATVFRGWVDGALADYAAAGGPDAVRLWDATIIGGANSRMIELAASDREALNYAEAAAAAFRSAIDRAGQPDGVIGADGKPEDFLDLDQYRRRLAYDGFVLALERAIIRLRGDRFLSGVGPQPGAPDFDRKLLAEIGYISLDLERRREALREEAEVNALIEPNSTWSLDTRGDFYWGTTVAQLGALTRIEAGLNGTPDLCARLAAHPYDVTRPTAAVDYDALDVDAVLTNCDDDSDIHRYYQARALAKAGTATPSEQFRLLLPSARAGLPIAYNNIALLVSDAGGPNDDVQALMTAFSELSLIKAYPQIAGLLRDQQTSAVRAEAYEWLAHKAAALGVPEAYVDIADLTPDVLTRAFNYTVARNLFRDAGRAAEADAMQARLDAFNLSSSNVESVEAQASGVGRITPKLLDEETIKRIDDLLWDARSQATLN